RMPNVVVTTIAGAHYKEEECLNIGLIHIREFEQNFLNIRANDNTVLCQKCEQLTAYLNNVNSKLGNYNNNILFTLYDAEINKLLNICTGTKCSSKILQDTSKISQYLSQEEQGNERGQYELSEKEGSQQRGHSQPDVKVLDISSQTQDVASRSVSIHQFSAHVSEIPASQVSSPTALLENAEVEDSESFSPLQSKRTEELSPNHKAQETLPDTTLLPTNSPDTHSVSLDNDGILGNISHVLVTGVSNFVDSFYETLFSGVFAHSQKVQNKCGHKSSNKIESDMSVTTNTHLTQLLSDCERVNDTTSCYEKTCGVHDINSSSRDVAPSGKNADQLAIHSESSHSTPNEGVTEEQVTSLNSHVTSNIPNMPPQATADSSCIDESFDNNGEESEDELRVTTGTDGVGSTGNGFVLDGSYGDFQRIPYILYIVIILV
ncbi:variable surface protein, partial [Plasmodium gonderi]